MQEATSLPSSPPVQDGSFPQRSLHSLMQVLKAAAGKVVQVETHACKEPPGHPPGDGVGVGGEGGGGDGVGVGGGGEALILPLFTYESDVIEPRALFNQHSLRPVTCV